MTKIFDKIIFKLIVNTRMLLLVRNFKEEKIFFVELSLVI